MGRLETSIAVKESMKQLEPIKNEMKKMIENGKEVIMNNTITSKEISNLRSIQNKCYQQAYDAGWHSKPREFGTRLALIHSEISEALEGHRKDLMDDHLPHRKMAEVELADAIIRILDTATKEGYDVASALAEKMEYNKTREDHKLENRVKDGGKSY